MNNLTFNLTTTSTHATDIDTILKLVSAFFFITVAVIGILANTFVLAVLLRSPCQQVYEIFCIGLAVTDLAFLTITVPLTTIQYLQDIWELGLFLCKFTFFIVTMTVHSSATMLLGLTCSRFLAVVHPWENRNMNHSKAKMACVAAWIIGAILSIPNPVYFDLKNENGTVLCGETFPETIRRTYAGSVLLFSYIIPFVAIATMNSLIVRKLKQEATKERKRALRRRVTKMVIMVTSLYGLCWLPTEIINVWYNAFREQFPYTLPMFLAKSIAMTLHYASGCINPIVYSVMSGTFKDAVAKQFPRIALWCGATESDEQQMAQRNGTETEHMTIDEKNKHDKNNSEAHEDYYDESRELQEMNKFRNEGVSQDEDSSGMFPSSIQPMIEMTAL